MNFYARLFVHSFVMLIAIGLFLNVLFATSCDSGLQMREKMNHIDVGTWGGEHIGIDVTDEGAKIEFDCAHGSIDGLIPLDTNNRFDVIGVYVEERGGPVRPEPEAGRAARYFGKIDGTSMSLTVEITDAKKELGTFTLELGKTPVIRKCD